MLITTNKYDHNAIKDNIIYCNFKDLTDINNSFTTSIDINNLIPFLKDIDKIKNNSLINITYYNDIIQIDIDSWYYVIIYNTNKNNIDKIKEVLIRFEYQNS